MQPLWQGLGYVALLRRLTALEQRSLAEHFKHRLAQSLGAIDHHQDGTAAGQNADNFGFNPVGEPLTASSFCGVNCYLALRRWRWARMPALRVRIQNRRLATGASLVKPLVCQKLMVDIVVRHAHGEGALPSCLRRCAAVMERCFSSAPTRSGVVGHRPTRLALAAGDGECRPARKA